MRFPNRTVAGLVAVLAVVASAGPPPPPANWTDAYVMANGIRIHYWRTGGAGKPVMVLAHGSSDDGLCFANLAKELESKYDLVLYDARGHGLSDPPSASDPADVQVEDLAGLIRELKLEKPILMGHSMGSSTVAWFAAKYPEVPRAVVLEDPGLAARRPGTAPLGAAGTSAQRRAAVLARNNMTYEQLVEDCRKNSPLWEPSECEFWAPSKRRHHPNTAMVTPGGGRPPVRELFAKVTCPVLILKADAQGDLRRENEEVAGILKNGRIVHIEGAAHNVRRDQKQRTLEVLKPFLAGV